jgi:hypothetical protein
LIVGIEKGDILAAGDRGSRIASSSWPGVFLSKEPDISAVKFRVRFDKSACLIVRSIIDDNNLELVIARSLDEG